jgi:hypothetical protein
MKNFLRFRNEDGKIESKTLYKLSFIFLGIASTIWFLLRVIPKPQRATYPCMRTAAPIMSSFVIYLISLGGSMLFFRKAFANLKKAKYWSAAIALAICLTLVAIFNLYDARTIYAEVFGVQFTRGVLPDAPNTPMGTAWGVKPGRVAWAWNPASTKDNCANTLTDAFFMSINTNQISINSMANKSIMAIGGKLTVKESWDAIFKSFNKKKTGTESGYIVGQKIFIKINNGQAGWAINSKTFAETGVTSATGVKNAVITETSPQALLAFVVQLVDSCGVAQGDIIIGEPMTHVYKSVYDLIHASYPNVIVIDKENHTSLGRTTSKGWKSDVIVYSDIAKVMTSAIKDDIMQEMYDADYMINIACLKAHARSGVTITAKNHFGSSSHGKSYSAERLHAGSINITAMSSANQGNDNLTNCRGDYNMYRVLTDLMGHEKLGRNTVLFVVDALWCGIEGTDMPVKWGITPFDNDWPSSLFVSQDDVAIQSVCIDFIRAEADKNTTMKDRPFFPAVDDYLHQAAAPANWPDSIKGMDGKNYKFSGYDPEGDGTFMSSLGVHEHWNNATDKKYSKNLSADGKGIELYEIDDTTTVLPTKPVVSVESSELTTLYSVYPNPCISKTCRISYKLASNANVSLYIINTEGKIVEQLRQGQLIAGTYNESINITNFKKGFYISVLKVNNDVKSFKFEVK